MATPTIAPRKTTAPTKPKKDGGIQIAPEATQSPPVDRILWDLASKIEGVGGKGWATGEMQENPLVFDDGLRLEHTRPTKLAPIKWHLYDKSKRTRGKGVELWMNDEKIIGVDNNFTSTVVSSIDHGGLAGLGDAADHTWAALVDGSRDITGLQDFNSSLRFKDTAKVNYVTMAQAADTTSTVTWPNQVAITAAGANFDNAFSALQTFTAGLLTDTISERTPAAGVTVDGCLIKDGIAANAGLLDGLDSLAFLKADGTVSLTGNLAVTALVTIDGRDLSVDGTKLDGIEAGATADQTAAEILTAIKTVDGAGSGLDADLIDGTAPTAFALTILDDATAAAVRATIDAPGLSVANTFTALQQFISSTNQSGANIAARASGNCIEFGHANIAGYGSTLGAQSGSGQPFLAFNSEHGTLANTFRTRGIPGALLISDSLGGFIFAKAATASADNQTATNYATLGGTGDLLTYGSLAFRGGGANAYTLAKAADAARTITFPDATTTLAGLGVAQTFTATQTITVNGLNLSLRTSDSSTTLSGADTQVPFIVRNISGVTNSYVLIGASDDSASVVGTIGFQIVDALNNYGEFLVAPRGTIGWNERWRIRKDGDLFVAANTIKVGDQLGTIYQLGTAITLTAAQINDAALKSAANTFTADLVWKSGTAFTGTLDHAATADRIFTFQDVSGTVSLIGVSTWQMFFDLSTGFVQTGTTPATVTFSETAWPGASFGKLREAYLEVWVEKSGVGGGAIVDLYNGTSSFATIETAVAAPTKFRSGNIAANLADNILALTLRAYNTTVGSTCTVWSAKLIMMW